MKRKNSEIIPIKTFKKKDTLSCYSGTSEKDKSIYDYFSLIRSKDKGKISKKPLSIIQDITRGKTLSTKYVIVKNPSKHHIPLAECNFPEAKYSNVFTEELLNSLMLNFERVSSEFSLAFNSEQFHQFGLSNKQFNNFIDENLETILIKFLLQLDDSLLYIPKGFFKGITNRNMLSVKDKERLKLLWGFDDMKHIAVQYNPINVTEAQKTSKGLCETLVNYINNFNNQIKENAAHKKALVIYNPYDYLESFELIETICNDLGYETLRIDELENQKLNRMKNLSEATKSQRLSTLSEDLIYKMNLIESIANYHKAKWQNLTQMIDENNNNLPLTESTTDSSEGFSGNSFNDPIFTKFQQNVHEIFIAKKTLLFIADPFPNDELTKPYLSNIISRIPSTKCPIILLTNNISMLTSPPATMKHFIFYHLDNDLKHNNLHNHVIYLMTIVLFFHLYLFTIQGELTNEEKSKTFYEAFLLNKLTGILTNDVMRIKRINENICERIIRLAIYISLKNKYNIDEISYEIGRLVRSVQEKDTSAKLRMIEKEMYGLGNEEDYDEDDDDVIEEASNDDNDNNMNRNGSSSKKDGNKNESLIVDINAPHIQDTLIYKVMQETEEISSEDYQQGIINTMSNKRHKTLNGYKSYDKDEVNCEAHIINHQLNLMLIPSNQNDYLLSNLYNDDFFIQIAKEDKRFFSNNFNTIFPFISTKTLPDHHSQMKYLHSISHTHKVNKFLNKALNYTNKKKTKSAKRMESCSVLTKLFRKTSDEQIKRYLNAHDYDQLVTKFKNDYFKNQTALSPENYYWYYKLIEKIKPNSLASSLSNTSANSMKYSIMKDKKQSQVITSHIKNIINESSP